MRTRILMAVSTVCIVNVLLNSATQAEEDKARTDEKVSLSYDRLPTFYQERDDNGQLGPPAKHVEYGENTQKEVTVAATAQGTKKVCPLVWQDVAYFVDKEGKRGDRIAIFGYQGCPFEIQGEIETLQTVEMREETKIQIEKATGNIIWISSRSARPLASNGQALGIGCEVFRNMTWVFKSKGIEFTTKKFKYTTEKAEATIRFTKEGVLMDGLKKIPL